ncbi:MAG: DNA repair protein RecO [Rhabdochlamydiaceae bacterium]
MIEEKNLLHTEGIVLNSFDYKEKERIVSLFTEKYGLLNLIIKRLSAQKSEGLMLSDLFSCGDFWIIKTKSGLYQLYQASIINDHGFLRKKFIYLKTAGGMGQAILASQWPEKPTPELYFLFKRYLLQIDRLENEKALLASFYLKLLFHEGTFNWDQADSFRTEEIRQLKYLEGMKKFSDLKDISIEESMIERLKQIIINMNNV